MDERTSRLLQELKRDPAKLQAVMRSRDGQALIDLLSRDGNGFLRAVRAAADGDSAALAERLRRVAETPSGAELLSRVQEAARNSR